MSKSKEIQFQKDIIADLTAQGWLTGPASGYDRESALYTEDFLGYFKEAWPKRWEKFAKNNPHEPEAALLRVLTRELEKKGTLQVLRKGFRVPGVVIETCSFKPDHGMTPETMARYQCNRLRVVPEVSYSPHARRGANPYNPRLDLVLFVNGIPTATLELKSEFKQSVELAKRQYQKDRLPKDPLTHKPEPLLTFKRGALVHFAVGQYEVAMTTRLQGTSTRFFPFNLGNEEGGAGNPRPADESRYATDYLWRRIFEPDAWLKILARFLHLEQQTTENRDGTVTETVTMIFPRYHQWEVVNKLIDATRAEGAGKRYLVQHSAGSGKSNSIAWAAHQLASLYDDEGERLFNSVIVITDRTVLDDQLQETISQFDHADGVVLGVGRGGGSRSKSDELAEALLKQTRIIVVTIQTFPALYEILERYPRLASGRYAVIADEAHSSQTGSSSTKLRQILGGDLPDGEELSSEDLLQAAVQARMPSESISYYAFTATPKSKTLELFGRLPNPDLPPGPDNLPEPFHLYTMRQAIEEGFILDVLKNYTTYQTAWRLGQASERDDEVDSKKARRKLARWVRLHPYNISQKVAVIVEHFRENVAHLLSGQAKAMVVTGSRQEAVRYHLAMQAYIKEQGYTSIYPLVAFSGTVPPDDVIPEEVTETSSLLNPGLRGRDMRDAFDTPDFNVMIVANKFQTGFDQPKLCAMYVDKRLHGVSCVQTLSRLNRTFGDNKPTFIVDFVNEGEDILNAFLPYYNKAELADVSDPQQIYDLQDKLDEEGIYLWSEVEAFARAFFDPKVPVSALTYHCQPAKERFAQRYSEAQEARKLALEEKRQAQALDNAVGLNRAEQALKDAGEELDRLELFRKDLQSFIRLYEFLSQIVPYEDTALEQLCVFARNLYPLLRIDRLQEDIDIGELQLTHYRLDKTAERDLRLSEHDGDSTLKPGSEVGSGVAQDPEKKRLSEIIEALNELFGAEIHDDDQLHFAQGIVQRFAREEDVQAQVEIHTVDQLMDGKLPARIKDYLLDYMQDNEKLSLEILSDEKKQKAFTRLILTMLKDPPQSPSP